MKANGLVSHGEPRRISALSEQRAGQSHLIRATPAEEENWPASLSQSRLKKPPHCSTRQKILSDLTTSNPAEATRQLDKLKHSVGHQSQDAIANARKFTRAEEVQYARNATLHEKFYRVLLIKGGRNISESLQNHGYEISPVTRKIGDFSSPYR